VEIMIVVAIIALLAAIAVPGFLRARKRSQASRIINDLRLIDSAVDQYAIETNKKSGDPVAVSDWTNYLKKGHQPLSDGRRHSGRLLRSPNGGLAADGPQCVEDRALRCYRHHVLVSLQLTARSVRQGLLDTGGGAVYQSA
jgi:Type II secretory pathway, pseudopilin PulG